MADTTPLQRPTGGQFSYNDWLGQQDNEATIQGVTRSLQPSQDLMPFQRKFRDFFVALTPAIGQVPIFEGEVPRGEMWLLHRAEASSTEGHTLDLNVLPKHNNAIVHTLGNFSLEVGIQTPLYPARWRQAAGNNENFNVEPGIGYTLLPGDTLQFLTAEVAVAPYTIILQGRYEILPAPNEDRADNEFTGTTI